MNAPAISSTKPSFCKARWDVGSTSEELGVQAAFKDDYHNTFYLFIGIPWILALTLSLSFTPGFVWRWLCRGEGECAFYGFRFCDYEVKFQWAKLLDLPGKGGGLEWRRTWTALVGLPDVQTVVVDSETVGATLPSTAMASFQHIHIAISQVVTTTRFPAWWVPTMHRTHYTFSVNGPVKQANGQPTTVPVRHYGHAPRMTSALASYVDFLHAFLGFDD